MTLKTYPPPPTIGDTKEIIKFAWIPTRVEDKLIWLERYVENWVYTTRKCSLNGKLTNPIPYDTWHLESTNLYSKPGLPDYEKPPPAPLDPDSRSLQTQIDLTKVIPGSPKMIREDFKESPKHIQKFMKDYLKQDPEIKKFAQRFRYFQK